MKTSLDNEKASPYKRKRPSFRRSEFCLLSFAHQTKKPLVKRGFFRGIDEA